MAYEGGYTSALNSQTERAYREAVTRRYLQEIEQQQQLFQQQEAAKQRALSARSGAGRDILALGGQMPGAQGAPPQLPQPPPPGQQSQPAPSATPQPSPQTMAAFGPQGPPQIQAQGMIQPPPGAGGQGLGGGRGAGPSGPPLPAAMSPQWQQMPKTPTAQPPAQAPGIPPPPQTPPQQQAQEPGAMNIRALAKQWQAEGVPPDQVMDRLDALTPFMTMQNKAELDNAKLQLQFQKELAVEAQKIAARLTSEAREKEQERHNKATEKLQGQRINITIGDKTAKRKTAAGFEGENGDLMAALAERGVSLPAGFRSKEQQIAMLNGLRKRNPDLTMDQIADKVERGQIDLNALKAESRTAGVIAGKVAYAEREIENIAPLVRAASAKVPRGNWVPWNKLKLYGEEQLSNPDLKELHSYLNTLSNAYDMLAARGGTDMEKRKINRSLFDTADSPEALERAIVAIENEAKASSRAGAASIKSKVGEPVETPATNAKGWKLHTDKNGNQAYVSPDGKQFEEIK